MIAPSVPERQRSARVKSGSRRFCDAALPVAQSIEALLAALRLELPTPFQYSV